MGRYGAKAPLIIGSLVAATGFTLFAIPSVGVEYWSGLFPGFVVLGLGMAVCVAPLTTVVMSSVDQDRAGTASGINNAIARLAGVLAIAVLGIVMITVFARSLRTSLATHHIDQSVVRALESNASRLGGLQIPSNLDPQVMATAKDAVRYSFVYAFRIMILLCAGLAILSAVTAWRTIPARSAGTMSEFRGDRRSP